MQGHHRLSTFAAFLHDGVRAVALTGVFVVLLLALTGVAMAQSFQTKARNVILLDAESGQIFYEKKADDLIPPASMSKIVTMLLVFDLLKRGKLAEDDEFEVSTDAWRRGGAPSGGSTMYAKPGERIKLVDLMRGVIIVSANDAAIAIAEGVAGSEEAFAQMLNKYARVIGLSKSRFANATGLPHPQHRMTARELALAARHLIRHFPEYYKLYSEREFTWNGIRQHNRNPLLGRYPGADGVKTGYTREAGYSLVASAKRDGRRLIAVITGLRSKRARAEEARKILDWGFRQFRPVRLFRDGETVTRVRVWGGDKDFVPVVVPEDIMVRLTDAERRKARLMARVKAPLVAPVKADERIGELHVLVGERTVARYPLMTGEAVAEDESMWGRALDTLKAWGLGG